MNKDPYYLADKFWDAVEANNDPKTIQTVVERFYTLIDRVNTRHRYILINKPSEAQRDVITQNQQRLDMLERAIVREKNKLSTPKVVPLFRRFLKLVPMGQ